MPEYRHISAKRQIHLGFPTGARTSDAVILRPVTKAEPFLVNKIEAEVWDRIAKSQKKYVAMLFDTKTITDVTPGPSPIIMPDEAPALQAAAEEHARKARAAALASGRGTGGE